VSRKRVARLLRTAGLQGTHRRRRRWTTRRDPAARPAPDLVGRQFVAERPDRLWHTDIKQVDTLEGPLYLAALIDGCSRACVGWAMAEHMRTELIIDALQMAVARRRPGVGLVQHSISEYVEAGAPGLPDPHSDGRARMLVPGRSQAS
jgi:transposase InsO family protein